MEKLPSQVTERAELKVGGSRGEQAEMGWLEPGPLLRSRGERVLGAGLRIVIKRRWAS